MSYRYQQYYISMYLQEYQPVLNAKAYDIGSISSRCQPAESSKILTEYLSTETQDVERQQVLLDRQSVQDALANAKQRPRKRM